jgi:hypothetical protein
MAHQVNRRDLAIIMSIRIPKAPAATRPHWIAITEVTAISTLQRLIVDCQTLTITLLLPPFLGRRRYCKWYRTTSPSFEIDSGYVITARQMAPARLFRIQITTFPAVLYDPGEGPPKALWHSTTPTTNTDPRPHDGITAVTASRQPRRTRTLYIVCAYLLHYCCYLLLLVSLDNDGNNLGFVSDT